MFRQRIFSKAALESLRRYRWPGNVREVENLCRRMTVMAPSREIVPGDLPAAIRHAAGDDPDVTAPR